jgi:hypothetical protein
MGVLASAIERVNAVGISGMPQGVPGKTRT